MSQQENENKIHHESTSHPKPTTKYVFKRESPGFHDCNIITRNLVKMT